MAAPAAVARTPDLDPADAADPVKVDAWIALVRAEGDQLRINNDDARLVATNLQARKDAFDAELAITGPQVAALRQEVTVITRQRNAAVAGLRREEQRLDALERDQRTAELAQFTAERARDDARIQSQEFVDVAMRNVAENRAILDQLQRSIAELQRQHGEMINAETFARERQRDRQEVTRMRLEVEALQKELGIQRQARVDADTKYDAAAKASDVDASTLFARIAREQVLNVGDVQSPDTARAVAALALARKRQLEAKADALKNTLREQSNPGGGRSRDRNAMSQTISALADTLGASGVPAVLQDQRAFLFSSRADADSFLSHVAVTGATTSFQTQGIYSIVTISSWWGEGR